MLIPWVVGVVYHALETEIFLFEFGTVWEGILLLAVPVIVSTGILIAVADGEPLVYTRKPDPIFLLAIITIKA